MLKTGHVLSGMTLAAVLFACSPADDSQKPSFDESSCPFPIHNSQVVTPGPHQTVRCGNLNVLETRGSESSRRIKVPVLIFKSSFPDQPPLVELAGGPGQSWADLGVDSLTRSDTANLGRDLIYIEQRGTGRSTPNLACPELEATSMDSMGANMDPIIACRDRLLRSGVDLSAYNSRAMAADVEDLRTTLGHAQLMLSGTSYGTDWGLEIMRQFPNSLYRVILDSVLPAHIAPLRNQSSGRDGALTALFSACQADSACNAKFPALDSKLLSTIFALEQKPLLWSQVSGGKFTASLYVSTVDSVQLLEPGLLPFFIETVYDTIQAGMTSLDAADLRLQALMMRSSTATASLATGMYLSVMCSQNQLVTTEEVSADLAHVRPALVPYLQAATLGLLSLCQEWRYAHYDASDFLPVTSDVPTLLLSGALDPRTPPAWAQDAVKTLRWGTLLQFPGLSHDVQSANTTDAQLCLVQVFQQFIPTGVVANQSCVAQISPSWILQ